MDIYDGKHGFRGGAYHRLDVAFQFHKDRVWFGKPVRRTIEMGAYNAYSRKNPFFYLWGYDDSNIDKPRLYQVSLFPIIPSISLNFKF